MRASQTNVNGQTGDAEPIKQTLNPTGNRRQATGGWRWRTGARPARRQARQTPSDQTTAQQRHPQPAGLPHHNAHAQHAIATQAVEHVKTHCVDLTVSTCVARISIQLVTSVSKQQRLTICHKLNNHTVRLAHAIHPSHQEQQRSINRNGAGCFLRR